MTTQLDELANVIERLYAHDELTAEGLEQQWAELLSERLRHENTEAGVVYARRVRDLLGDARDILNAYEEVS